MLPRAAARPQLRLNIVTGQNPTRPSLSLKSPGPLPRTPLSPSPISPTARRYSSLQPPAYNYTNSCSSKSILKKHSAIGTESTAKKEKEIQFKGTPTVYCVTPIENPEEYYGTHTKLTREERRWIVRE